MYTLILNFFKKKFLLWKKYDNIFFRKSFLQKFLFSFSEEIFFSDGQVASLSTTLFTSKLFHFLTFSVKNIIIDNILIAACTLRCDKKSIKILKFVRFGALLFFL